LKLDIILVVGIIFKRDAISSTHTARGHTTVFVEQAANKNKAVCSVSNLIAFIWF